MKKFQLSAKKRQIHGHKVKTLRKQGILPANVFGKATKSQSLEVNKDEFLKLYKEAGNTSLVELKIDGVTKPTLIHNVQTHPLDRSPLHIDFLEVNLKEKIKALIPLEISGQAPAVAQKLGVLLTLLDKLEVEALPAELPEKLTVDVSGLTEVGKSFKVSDLTLPHGVMAITDKETELVKVGELVTREAEKQAQEEAAKKAEAVAATAAPTTPSDKGAVVQPEKKAEAPQASSVKPTDTKEEKK